MRYRTRIYYTEEQKSQMWDRWQRGDSLHQIARLFDRHHGAVRQILAASGGIRPPLRRRSPRALTLAEREVISRGLVAGHGLRTIAISLQRAPSTISREIARNGGPLAYLIEPKRAWLGGIQLEVVHSVAKIWPQMTHR